MEQTEGLSELVKLAKSGDAESFGEIYNLLIDRVYRFVYFRVRTKEDAEDLSEQIFLKAYEGLNGYQEKGFPFEAWIFRIARNLVIDYYRTRRQIMDINDVGEVKDNGKSPEDCAENSLTKEALLNGIALLPASYQEIIILKFIEERENDEISQILHQPVGHIRVLQNRALKALRRIIDGKRQ